MGSSSRGSGDQKVDKRYAPYIENKHQDFLDSTVAHRVIDDAPGYATMEASDAFFGTGYVISNFPSLYDMFGKFMAGLDIEVLWRSAFNTTMNSPEITLDIAAQIDLADEQIVKGDMADFQFNMRDKNATSTSSFIVGKAVLEDKRIKTFARISLDARTLLLSKVGQNLVAHLNWSKNAITTYADTMKSYFLWKMDVDEANYTFKTRTALWPFTSLDFERAALATLQSIASFSKTMEPRDRSTISKALLISSYAVSGAYIGSTFGPWGTVIGTAIGFVIGLAAVFFE